MVRILVIDDDEAIRAFYCDALESAGYVVEQAANGEEGVEAFRRNPATVVICDIFMPLKDGLETIVELRRDYPGVHIIAASGRMRDGVDYAGIVRRLGAVQTLEKPFTSGELFDAVKAALDAV